MSSDKSSQTKLSSSWEVLESLLPVSDCDEPNLTVSNSSQDSFSKPLQGNKEFGRYTASIVLGEGGYGRVFKAYDDQLQRHVAVKVPHLHRLTSNDAVKHYLAEARTVAKLEHPGVVAVHDVGVTDDGLPYIVSAYIDGTSLAESMHRSPPKLRDGLRILIQVAEALQYVHSQDIIHRDIKPGNILLNQEGKPFLADFGLALRDEINEPRRARVGTPAYMSPEQARGESHLVDGRSDIFSLGIVLYEMLTGKRPFRGRDSNSIYESLLNQEPRPPRQHNSELPRDLERICLKALAKRSSNRYSNAGDLAEDIQHFLDTCESDPTSQAKDLGSDATAKDTPDSQHHSGVVPRGLRSYDRHDADFFNRLLPGPRDRDWVPESIRFWQRQIENLDNSDPPRVGVLYGPSGCGKSSFVKAGLLPLLDKSIKTVFVEATAQDTESRLLRGIRRRYPNCRPEAGLVETLSQVRNERDQVGSPRLLIVVDQFEQWLHGRSNEEAPELANAFRQCDGYAVQCLLLVRDDFWLALSRFMAILDIPLKQNHNAALVDLFSVSHAEKVLTELGAAYDCLPPDSSDFTAEQLSFIRLAAEQLADSGKVFPVRLTLFVEMVKSQAWTPATLSTIGGVDGIGVRFLEESFSSDLAPIAQRTHEPAVRNILRRLLPEQGIDIKGHMRSEEDLLKVSGYEDQPSAFREMMRVLDTDLRLVTPTDPSGTTTSDDSISQSGDGVRYYQLTHDYLVPAITSWLTRRQRETRRGRAELRLADYTSVWSSKPLMKYTPPWIDWASISLWSSPRHWNSSERRMMRQASKRHLIRTAAVVSIVALIWMGTNVLRSRAQSLALVNQLQTARTSDLKPLLKQISERNSHVDPALREKLKDASPGSRSELVNRLGLMQHDSAQGDSLMQAGLRAEIPIVLLIRDQIHPLSETQVQLLREVLSSSQESRSQKLRAAFLLKDVVWHTKASTAKSTRDEVAEKLVEELLQHAKIAPQDHTVLIEGIFPFFDRIAKPIRTIASNSEDTQRRSIATSILTQSLLNKPRSLLDFFLDGDAAQHESILPSLAPLLSSLLPRIREVAFEELDEGVTEAKFDAMARRKGTAAALLHRLGQADSTWPLLAHTPMPHARGYFIHRIAPLGGNFELLLSRYSRETRPSIRRALIVALGQFDWSSLSDSLKLQAVASMKDAFQHEADVGIHSTTEWVLRKWGYKDWVYQTILDNSSLPPDPRKNWFVTKEGHTMAIFDARGDPEIGRVFAISTKEVSVEQFLRFNPEHEYYIHRSPSPDCPVGLLDWFDCLAYCRWLSEQLEASPEQSYPPDLTENNPEVDYGGVVDSGAYRLPTDAEWQYACAALTTSRCYYGWSTSLADHYFWHYTTAQNEEGKVRYFPNGLKEPNDFGMFAMYDNVREWGHQADENRRSVFGFTNTTIPEEPQTLDEPIPADLPASRNGFYGLRVASTIVASP